VFIGKGLGGFDGGLFCQNDLWQYAGTKNCTNNGQRGRTRD
jgi:hypothetical protein